MARGILVSYAGYPYTLSSLFPDNGLASLAAVLRAEGHECTILDFNTAEMMVRMVDSASHSALEALLSGLRGQPEPEALAQLFAIAKIVEARGEQVAEDVAALLANRCRAERLDFVGFKLWNGDGFDASVRIAERLRMTCPMVKLFAGGPSVHYWGKLLAEEAPIFDAVVDHEGEEAILELARFAEGARGLEGIPNLITTHAVSDACRSAELSLLPLPSYAAEVYPAVANGEKIRMFCIDESRGCPMQCAFCINRCIEGKRWRTRTPTQVLEQIKSFLMEHNSRAFRLAGTYSPPKLVREICEQIIAEQLDVEFGLFLHTSAMQPKLLELLKAAGCYGLFCGVESGSDAVLQHAMNKHTSAARIRNALLCALRQGLFVAASFIYPAPFETRESEQQTRQLIHEVFSGQPRAAVNLCFAGLLPRTTWWQEQERFGFELQVTERAYGQAVLRYKIRHLVPPTLWEPLPYRLAGQSYGELAQLNEELQQWVRAQQITTNLADHDAQVGEALGYPPVEFQQLLRRVFFTGAGEALQDLVDRANAALHGGAHG